MSEKLMIPAQADEKFSRQVLRYTLMFIITAISAYALFIVVPKTFLSNADGNIDGIAQQYPIYSEIKRMLPALLGGSSWAWDIGLGEDALIEFSTKLLNPLTYLVIAFPQKYLDVGFTLMVLVSQYLSGLSFMVFGRKAGFDYRQNITGGICYAFCGWVIQAILRQGTFLMATILFPLLILGLKKILRKESPLVFIAAVAAHVIYSIQWAYAGALAVFLYMAVRLLTRDGSAAKEAGEAGTGEAVTKMMLSGLAGVMISGPVLLWSLARITDTTTGTTVSDPLFYPLSQFFEIPTGFFLTTPTTNAYTVLGVPSVCVILIPLALKGLKKKTPQSIMAFGLFALSLLPVTGRVFNGFSYSVGRWFYILMFFMIWACMDYYKPETFEDRKNARPMMLWTAGLALWGIAVCWLILDIIDFTTALTVFAGAVFCALFIVTLFRGGLERGIKYGILIAALLTANITVYVNTNLFPGLGEQIHTLCRVGRIESDFGRSTQRIGPEVQAADTGFYRIDQVDGYTDTRIARVRANENMYFGNRSVYTYTSTMDKDWHVFNRAVGNNAGYFDRTTSFSNDNREGLDLLLGVRYFLGDNPDMKPGASGYAPYGFAPSTEIEKIEVLKNKYDAGIGYAFGSYITESELEQFTPLEREQVMLQTAVVPDEEAGYMAEKTGVKHADTADLLTDIKELPVDVSGLVNVDMEGSPEGGTLTISKDKSGAGSFDIEIPKTENCRIMIAFEGFVRDKCDFDSELALRGKTFKGNVLSGAVKRASYVDDEKFKIEISRGDTVKAAQMRKGKNQGFSDVKDFYINLGYFDSIDGKVHVDIDRVGVYHFDSIKAYAVPVEIYDRSASAMMSSAFMVSDHTGDALSGSLDVKKDSLLFLSILDSTGWDFFLDGEKLGRENIIKNTDMAFTGVAVPAGKHTLELRYATPYLAQGAALTLAGLLLAAFLVIRNKNKRADNA